jgi:hypothetical protein
MKVKFSPCRSDKDTVFEYIDHNKIKIDGEEFEFDALSVEWPDILKQSGGKILEAKRDDLNVLQVVVLRFYTVDLSWDTGDYHDIDG